MDEVLSWHSRSFALGLAEPKKRTRPAGNSIAARPQDARSRIIAIVVFDLEKTGDLAHSYSAACIVAAFSFAISTSARRYSTGITLRNNGR